MVRRKSIGMVAPLPSRELPQIAAQHGTSPVRALSDLLGRPFENRRRFSERKLFDVPQDEGGAVAGVDPRERFPNALWHVRALKQRIESGRIVRRQFEATIVVERRKETLERLGRGRRGAAQLLDGQANDRATDED